MGQKKTGRSRGGLTREDREKFVSVVYTEVCLGLCCDIETGEDELESNWEWLVKTW
jgi:hypothetical protein